MPEDRPSRRSHADLRDRVALSLAFEEQAIGILADAAAQLRQEGQEERAREFEDQIRSHRVGLMQTRAILAARGIKV